MIAYNQMTPAELAAEVERLLAALPPGKWVHDRYRNERGWWSALIQERDDVPMIDSVIRLLRTDVADQEKGGDLIEFVVRTRLLLPLLVNAIRSATVDSQSLLLDLWEYATGESFQFASEDHIAAESDSLLCLYRRMRDLVSAKEQSCG